MSFYKEEVFYEDYSFEELFSVELYNLSEETLYELYYHLYLLESNFESLYNDKMSSSQDKFILKTSDQEIWPDEKTETITRIHNYLSSVWSFVEYVDNEFNVNFHKSNGEKYPPKKISRACKFLVGARHIIQHGKLDLFDITTQRESENSPVISYVYIAKNNFIQSNILYSEERAKKFVKGLPSEITVPKHTCKFQNKLRSIYPTVIDRYSDFNSNL